jgi:hypothetical protein
MGLVVEFSGSQTVLWYKKHDLYLDNLTSTFRYKNAYATYPGLGLIATITLLIRALGRNDYTAMGRNERLHSILTLIFEKIWYLFIAFIALFTALLLSDSRGGVLSTIVALLFFAIVMRTAPHRNLPYGKTYFAGMLVVSFRRKSPAKMARYRAPVAASRVPSV